MSRDVPGTPLLTAMLALLTTTGDMLYASAANTLARLAIGTTGSRLVVNGSGVPAWIPIGTVALSVVEGSPDTCAVDVAAGAAFTATLDEATAFTWSNETYGHQAWLLKLTTSGTVAEPTWPAGMTRIGSGAWVTTTATVNYVHVFRLATGTYIYTVAQAA